MTLPAGELTLEEGQKIRAAFGERIKLEDGISIKTPDTALTLTETYDARLRSASGKKKLDADLEIDLPAGSILNLPQGARVVHIYYGEDSGSKLQQRQSEIEQLTEALANKAKDEFKLDSNAFLGVLGDFNIIGRNHPTMQALESNSFVIPDELKTIPGSNVARDRAYDQIAFWKPVRTKGYARLDVKAANIFDFYEHVFTLNDEATYRAESNNGLKANTSYKTWRTYKMSDHLPMWIELRTDFGEEYLEAME